MPETPPPEIANGEMISAAINIAALVIARMIGTNKLDPSKITSRLELASIIGKLGRTHDDAFELHIERAPKKLETIHACIKNHDPESAVVLLYTLIEGEVNTVIRMLLRIRGFSHSAISDALRGTDFKSKLDIVLPLLGIDPGPRIRQLGLESQAIRNASVHFKAQPTSWMDSNNREGDHTTNHEKALEFLGRNSIANIETTALTPFVNLCLSQCPELQQAHVLLKRFKA